MQAPLIEVIEIPRMNMMKHFGVLARRTQLSFAPSSKNVEMCTNHECSPVSAVRSKALGLPNAWLLLSMERHHITPCLSLSSSICADSLRVLFIECA